MFIACVHQSTRYTLVNCISAIFYIPCWSGPPSYSWVWLTRVIAALETVWSCGASRRCFIWSAIPKIRQLLHMAKTGLVHLRVAQAARRKQKNLNPVTSVRCIFRSSVFNKKKLVRLRVNPLICALVGNLTILFYTRALFKKDVDLGSRAIAARNRSPGMSRRDCDWLMFPPTGLSAAFLERSQSYIRLASSNTSLVSKDGNWSRIASNNHHSHLYGMLTPFPCLMVLKMSYFQRYDDLSWKCTPHCHTESALTTKIEMICT